MACPHQPINLDTLAIKAESTVGTYNAPLDADFDVRVRNIEITPNLEVDDENSKYATGDDGGDEAIAGAQSATITCSVKCAWSGTANTEPKWWKFAKACGCTTISYTTTGISLVKRADNNCDTYSIVGLKRERGTSGTTTEYQFAGCMGNMVLTAENIGAPWTANFTFQGKLVDIVDGTALTLTGNDTTVAEKMLGNTFTIGGTAEKISTFSYDLGNEINPVIDQSDGTGYGAYGITAANPRFTCNPYGVKQATRDWLDEWLTETGSVISNNSQSGRFTLSVLRAQLLNMAMSNREGLGAYDLTFKPLRANSTGLVTNSSHTAEDTFEFLQGSYT